MVYIFEWGCYPDITDAQEYVFENDEEAIKKAKQEDATYVYELGGEGHKPRGVWSKPS